MPASSPWIDRWAPAQWFIGDLQNAANTTGAQGSVSVNPQTQPSSFDTTLHWKVSGTILLALVVIFGLQFMGFRFVVAANTSFGVGRK